MKKEEIYGCYTVRSPSSAPRSYLLSSSHVLSLCVLSHPSYTESLLHIFSSLPLAGASLPPLLYLRRLLSHQFQGDIFYKLASARAGREVRQGHRPHGMGQEGLKPPVTGLASACPFSAALVKQKQGHVEDGKESGMEKNQNGYHEQSVGEEEKMVEKILPAGEA